MARTADRAKNGEGTFQLYYAHTMVLYTSYTVHRYYSELSLVRTLQARARTNEHKYMYVIIIAPTSSLAGYESVRLFGVGDGGRVIIM